MPNWCDNLLTITGEKKRLEEFDEKFKGLPVNWNEDDEKTEPKYCFNALYPVPKEVIKIGYSKEHSNNNSVEEKINVLFDKDKWWDGYSWCISHWGCKWDIYGYEGFHKDKNGDKFYYSFQTAWAPPIPWLEKVAGDWRDLKFTLAYYEEGVGFAGKVFFSEGKLVEEVEHCSEKEPEKFIQLVKEEIDPDYAEDFCFYCSNIYMDEDDPTCENCTPKNMEEDL